MQWSDWLPGWFHLQGSIGDQRSDRDLLLMIQIPAKVKCDNYPCEATVEVVVEVTISESHDIPRLTVENMPEGWCGAWGPSNRHCCPEHNPYIKKKA